nr:integrase, catalytic region, zinc finger, CCHC-type, peptidase aspartic, catalytic [Tanacetum cinerariifolium]
MTTLAEFMILSGADNRPPMFDKDLYDSWKSRMELYMQNKEHGRMILELVKHGLLIWHTIEKMVLPGQRNMRNFNQQTHLANFLQIDSGLAVPVFKQGDDPIDAFNKMMSFLSTVVTSRFPSTDNQGRQILLAAGTFETRANISGTKRNNSGQQRVVKCFNCQGEGHMARQCPKPKRKKDATWFKDKVLLVEAQGVGKVLNEEELAFLADPGVVEAKVVLMANSSSYGLDVLSQIPHFENTHNDMLNQSVQEIPYSRQTHLMNYLENEIRPMLYDGTIITKETNVILIADSEETLMLDEESRSKMPLKLSKSFVPQHELSDEQAFWLQNLHPDTDQSPSSLVKIKAPRELSKENDIVNNATQVSNDTTIALGMYKLDPVTLAPKDKNKRETHIYYLKHTMEQAAILREIVVQDKSLNPLDSVSYSSCKHELCFFKFVSDMNACSKAKTVKKAKKKEEWQPTRKVFTKIGYNRRPTGRTFTLVRNACLLTSITATNKVPFREPTPLEVVAQEPIVTKIAKIMEYGDYHIANIIISRVYYVKGIGHNLFFVGQFCDSDLEVAFRKHTCFVRNLEDVDLLSRS